MPTKQLLIVAHAPSDNTRKLAEASPRGAGSDSIASCATTPPAPRGWCRTTARHREAGRIVNRITTSLVSSCFDKASAARLSHPA